MQTTRINNISLFVTVLSACLGLLAVGTAAPIYAQQETGSKVRASECAATNREEAEKSFAAIGVKYLYSPEFAQKHADASNQHLGNELCYRNGDTNLKEFLYRNARASAYGTQVLIVTRLPRAALNNLLAEQSAAN